MKPFSLITGIFAFLFLSGCQSGPSGPGDLRLGMTRSDVARVTDRNHTVLAMREAPTGDRYEVWQFGSQEAGEPRYRAVFRNGQLIQWGDETTLRQLDGYIETSGTSSPLGDQ